MKIAFQGIRGAYSEMALHSHFGKDVESVGCDAFDDVFDAVNSGAVTFGLIPVENTIAGSVVENYDLLFANEVFVIAEVYLPIRHTLLAKKGARLEDITQAFSHPHALKQCKEFLKSQNIKMMPTYDTAGAAQAVAEGDRVDCAAIASELCAEIYDMQILASDIQSNTSNTTRFFVIAKKESVPEDLVTGKTTVAFKTRHYPGALLDCLKIFQKYKLNLSKLESRPIPENPWEYVFYAAFEAGIDQSEVKSAIGELTLHAVFVKLLGSYPKAEKCW
ncbi:prephenate dehydratase [Desulfosarcina ovata]|uniref:Prephenate dehydratase n=2 Tax=Desulfosarcina ovata TaxID=83564 RepID=A0A5K8AD71_9BACT|nr:prephenate dehydratase [Desulfosarcina ovata]BBO84087.1 prephenate dehydratase [Desulfosarcina ovata subsp. sediminis]BBO90585.1 prephenate dehydratase [Desulfosarcina ovata subsp. ovata]